MYYDFLDDAPKNKMEAKGRMFRLRQKGEEHIYTIKNKRKKVCPWCSESPCLWACNANAMDAWDEGEHGLLVGDDFPSNNTRRKSLYRQMALTISGGPIGKGECIVLPNCVKDGIRALLPDVEGKYMGHMES